MKYLSLFSGIEAASVAWQPLGWNAVAFAEVEKFPSAVLAHHYPDVPNLGDVTKITADDIKALGHIDIVVGGSPCQDLSVAGKRAGLAGERSGLFYEQLRIFNEARQHCGARFLVWENVPGAFSINKGRDFAQVVGEMAGLRDVEVPKYGWGYEGAALGDNGLLEWSILDAQYFGVAQRRRRVFALLDTGDWESRKPILLERESVRGNTAPSRKEGEDSSSTVRGGVEICGSLATKEYKNEGTNGMSNTSAKLIPVISKSLCAHGVRLDSETETFVPVAFGAQNSASQGDSVSVEFSPTLDKSKVPAVAHYDGEKNGYLMDKPTGPLTTMQGGGREPGIVTSTMQVRRLTPKECERLQGFSDDYTQIPWRNKDVAHCPDGPRYKALGNSMAVPVMRWIGKQIDEVTNERN